MFEIDKKWDSDKFDEFDTSTLNKKNKEDVEGTREYCDRHEFYYGNHTCEPIWDDVTGDLSKYEIVVHQNKKDKLKFVKKRNEKKTMKKKAKKKKS